MVEEAVSVFNHMRAEALSESDSAALIEARRRELGDDAVEPQARVLRFTPEEWVAFLSGVHAGEFDSLGE